MGQLNFVLLSTRSEKYFPQMQFCKPLSRFLISITSKKECGVKLLNVEKKHFLILLGFLWEQCKNKPYPNLYHFIKARLN